MATRNGFVGTVAGTLWRNRYLGCAMAIHRRVLEVALPVPSYVPMHDMWLGVMGHLVGRVVYLPTPYLQYRRHGANASPASRQSWHRMITWRIALLGALVSRLPLVAVRRWRRSTESAAPPCPGDETPRLASVIRQHGPASSSIPWLATMPQFLPAACAGSSRSTTMTTPCVSPS